MKDPLITALENKRKGDENLRNVEVHHKALEDLLHARKERKAGHMLVTLKDVWPTK